MARGRPKIDLTGRRFGRWTVIRFHKKQTPTHLLWWCQCDCGTERAVAAGGLGNGSSTSCGCFRLEQKSTHGYTHRHVYKVWAEMLQRCNNPHHRYYGNYGGRGITVCERWLFFENFIADLGDPPDGMMLERMDNDAGYNPENCKWATRTEQNRNRRFNRLITFNNETMCLAEWAEKLNIRQGTLSTRLANGWSLEEALCQTVYRGSQSRKNFPGL